MTKLAGDLRFWFAILTVIVVLLGIWLDGLHSLRENYFSLIAALASLTSILVGWKSLGVMQRQLDILRVQQDLLLRLPDVTIRVRHESRSAGSGEVLEVPWNHSISLWFGVLNRGNRPARDVYVKIRFPAPLIVGGYQDVQRDANDPQVVETHVEGPVYRHLTMEFGMVQIQCPQETQTYRVDFTTISEEGTKSDSLSLKVRGQ